MEAMREIEALVDFEGRAAGTDAERRAAGHLAGRLRALGREAEVESIYVHPNWALTHLIHALVAIAGSVTSVGAPTVGALLVAFAALSTLGDMTGTLFLVRRVTGRRASQNVMSREGGGKFGVLVLVAHYDVARGGLLFSPWIAERRAALTQRLRLPIGLGGAFLLAMAAVLACAVLRGLGIDSVALSAVQFIPTALLVLSVPLLADVQLSRPVPGAADNAAGVATALRLAERHGGELEYLDLWVLFTGAEESMALGMREWLRRHRSELAEGRTFFINLDKLGRGAVRYSAREGPVLAARNDRTLVEACQSAEGGGGAHVARGTSDALVARSRGFPAITISCLNALRYQPDQHQPGDIPERVDPEALEGAFAFASNLLDGLDQRVGPDLERAAAG